MSVRLIAGLDGQLLSVVALSLEISLAAAITAALIGLPLGALIAVERFPGRRLIVVMLNEAWHFMSSAIRDLVDQTIQESMQMVVNRHLIRHFDSYQRLDRVRSRKAGGDIFIEIFLAFSGDRTLDDIQPLIDDLRTGIEKEIRRASVTVVARAASAVLETEAGGAQTE